VKIQLWSIGNDGDSIVSAGLGLLCADSPASDGGNPKKAGHQEVLRQHDHRDPPPLDELSGITGICEGHLPGM
jgi:hypothetical protein